MTFLSTSSLALVALLVTACSATMDAEPAADQAELRQGQSIVCTPTDADEACFDGAGADFCVEKLTLTKVAPSKTSLTIERTKYSTGAALPPTNHERAESFQHSTRKLAGVWDGGDTWIDAEQTSGAKYAGSAAVEEDFGFQVECKLQGAADVPLYVRTAALGAGCNQKNAAGSIVRCVLPLMCADGQGHEIAMTERRQGTCKTR